MIEREFESPPFLWAVLPVVGGIATGIGLIWALESFGDRVRSEPQGTFQSTPLGMPAQLPDPFQSLSRSE